MRSRMDRQYGRTEERRAAYEPHHIGDGKVRGNPIFF